MWVILLVICILKIDILFTMDITGSNKTSHAFENMSAQLFMSILAGFVQQKQKTYLLFFIDMLYLMGL